MCVCVCVCVSRKQNDLEGKWFSKMVLWTFCLQDEMLTLIGWCQQIFYIADQMGETTGGQNENHLRICMLHRWEETWDDFSFCWLLNTYASGEEIFQPLIRWSLQQKRGKMALKLFLMQSQQPASEKSPAGLRARGTIGAPSDATLFVENRWKFINHHLIMIRDQIDTVKIVSMVTCQSANPFTWRCCVNRTWLCFSKLPNRKCFLRERCSH